MFIVAYHACEEVDQGPDAEEEVFESDVKDLILCNDAAAVAEALQGSRVKKLDWAVFEVIEEPTSKKVGAFDVMKSRTVRCSVVFEKDGVTIKRIG